MQRRPRAHTVRLPYLGLSGMLCWGISYPKEHSLFIFMKTLRFQSLQVFIAISSPRPAPALFADTISARSVGYLITPYHMPSCVPLGLTSHNHTCLF